MFARAAAVLLVALPVLVVSQGGGDECTTGSLQCCSSFELVTNVGDVVGGVGINCSPVTVVGAGGTSCSEQPFCCSGTTFNGLIATGCTPIRLSF
ncbi:hypothetical protein CVT26_011773 [Gymnopilus dilepis]|uniref:Hydrophobin n=1 Tax=Gymnopilus dilepis TaxID=231916 RepID=A0A409W925_9AGAR|nr:hypothetical protein CVT26_011773 [Gymnopilus dilepis]